MSAIHFTTVLIIVMAAFLAPLALGFVPRLRLPAVVLEICFVLSADDAALRKTSIANGVLG